MSSHKQPNILLIVTDQQRYDSLGCYGFEGAHTPNLDQVARDGAMFEHCYVNNPICTPSRASLMTGKHLPGHGVYQLHTILSDENVLFPEHLQRLGYRTALFGKLHVSATKHEIHQRHPHDGFDIYEWTPGPFMTKPHDYHGYHHWLAQQDAEFASHLIENGKSVEHIPSELHFTHWAAERSIDFIRQQDRSQPFFCKMSIFDPHNPYNDYPSEMHSLVDPEKIPPPMDTDIDIEQLPDGVQREIAGNYWVKRTEITPETVQAMRYGYHASIAFADQEIGRVLTALEEQGLAEDTLVIFTSDHGDMLGDHRLFVKGAFFYDANVRVPLLMRWGDHIQPDQNHEGLVQLHDLAATILQVAGMPDTEIQQWMPESRSLLPIAQGESDRVRDYAICCYRNSGLGNGVIYWDPPIHATMIRDERFKLNHFHDNETDAETPQGELYDMIADPHERFNLWDHADYATTRAHLSGRLINWLGLHERSLTG